MKNNRKKIIGITVFSFVAILVSFKSIGYVKGREKRKNNESLKPMGEKVLKEEGKKATIDAKKLSKFQRVVRQLEGTDDDTSLTYKVKIEKKPFFSLMKSPEKKKAKLLLPPKKEVKKQKRIKRVKKAKDIPGIYTLNFSETPKGKSYKAKIERTQIVRYKNQIQAILKESIPSLNLEKGVQLTGLATIEGTRVKIRFTMARQKNERKRVDLECYDIEDGMLGIYHDDLAKLIEEDTQDGILDEALSLDFKGARLGKKAAKISNKQVKNIYLMRGRELYVKIREKKR